MAQFVEAATSQAEIWITAGAGLVGALIGGVAVLVGTRLEARNARKLAREQRVEGVFDEVLRDLWGLMGVQYTDLSQPTNEVLDDLDSLQRISRLSSLTVDSEPALSHVVHEYGNSFEPQGPIRDTRLRAAALSGALHLWQRNPDEFKKRDWGLVDYELELAYDFADRHTVRVVFEE